MICPPLNITAQRDELGAFKIDSTDAPPPYYLVNNLITLFVRLCL